MLACREIQTYTGIPMVYSTKKNMPVTTQVLSPQLIVLAAMITSVSLYHRQASMETSFFEIDGCRIIMTTALIW